MFILKNAFRSICRSKGRNILIGIIVAVLTFSACISLSIRQAAKNAEADSLSALSITASISFDRQATMEKNREQMPEGDFDKSAMKEAIQGMDQGLSLAEYQKYAEAESVDGFYYSGSVSVNGSEDLDAVNSNEQTASDSNTPPDLPSGPGFERGSFMGTQGDFTIIGYSDESAMTDFLSGKNKISDGAVFAEGTDANECIISNELSILNDISVGDTLAFTNPNNEEESFSFKVVGIYTAASENESGLMRFSASQDAANQIYTSYAALKKNVAALEGSTDEQTKLILQTNAYYTFSDPSHYEKFESEARALGLNEKYTVSSMDVEQYEQSLVPLENLSKFAMNFLFVVLAIGGIILVVLNIFNVRERKYEIGVLTAIGMKKGKVALQFITEIFIVTLISMIVGVAVGAPVALPVTNALLQNQISSQQKQVETQNSNFGRASDAAMTPPSTPDSLQAKGAKYISEVTSATDFSVLLKLLLIAVVLTLVSGLFAVIFIMRYDPLRILSERE